MALTPELTTGLVAIGSALVGALPGVISSVFTKRSEERRQFKELVLRAAMESWKTIAQHPNTKAVMPLEHYIIHTAQMCEFALGHQPITPETMTAQLVRVGELMEVLRQHALTPPPSKPP